MFGGKRSSTCVAEKVSEGAPRTSYEQMKYHGRLLLILSIPQRHEVGRAATTHCQMIVFPFRRKHRFDHHRPSVTINTIRR